MMVPSSYLRKIFLELIEDKIWYLETEPYLTKTIKNSTTGKISQSVRGLWGSRDHIHFAGLFQLAEFLNYCQMSQNRALIPPKTPAAMIPVLLRLFLKLLCVSMFHIYL